MNSPYSAILINLLDSVNGAVAVGFADYEGETIQLEGSFDGYAHKLHLACQGIVLHNLQAIHRQTGEAIFQISSIYQNFHVMIQPLIEGYLLVLTLQRGSNLYQASKRLALAARQLNQDLQ
jgi:hypothetical protein